MRISVVVPVSRPECIPLVKDNLANLDLGGHECDLVVIADFHQISTQEIIDEVGERFARTVGHNTGKPKPLQGDAMNGRTRIAQLRNESRALVGDTDFVFSFEDDSVVPKNALVKLISDFQECNKAGDFYGKEIMADRVGLVSGIQVGRHSRKMLGAWYADNYQFPTEFKSLGKDEIITPLAEVDATGMYCYLTPTHLYAQATYGWHDPVGPDVYYGLYLRMKGYVNYVDQSVVVGHRVNEHTILTPDNTEVVRLRLFQNNLGTWLNEPVREKA